MKAIYVDPRAAAEPPVARRPVSAVMSYPVATVSRTVSLADALRRMVTSGVRHLVVLDDAGTYFGVVSDRMIGAAWSADPGGLSTQPISSIVDNAGPTVGTDTAVVAAARAMRAAKTDAVAVVDPGGAVLGIVTGTDLISLLARYPAGS